MSKSIATIIEYVDNRIKHLNELKKVKENELSIIGEELYALSDLQEASKYSRHINHVEDLDEDIPLVPTMFDMSPTSNKPVELTNKVVVNKRGDPVEAVGAVVEEKSK